MKFQVYVKVLAFFVAIWSSGGSGYAQTPLKELRVEYNKAYQLENSYTIIYDNTVATAKLENFKVEFYAPGRVKLGSTDIETFPLLGKIEGYELSEPIIGFTEVQLVILSLYAGDISDMSSDANSLLALNELTEVPQTVEPVISNTAPIARDGEKVFEASTEGFSVNISEFYSDPDGDALTVTRYSEKSGTFPYLLEADGTLKLMSPSTVGIYAIPFEARDTAGLSALATFTLEFEFPRRLREQLDEISTSNTRLLAVIEERIRSADSTPKIANNLDTHLSQLLTDNEALSNGISEQALAPLKGEIELLTQRLKTYSSGTSRADYVAALIDLKSQANALAGYLGALEIDSETTGTEITAFESALITAGPILRSIANDVKFLSEPKPFTAVELAEAETEHAELMDIVHPSGDFPWGVALAIVAGILLLGLLLKMTGVLGGKGKLPSVESKPNSEHLRPEHPPNAGVVFANSPLLAGAVAPGPTPLAPLGQMVPSGLQTLSGEFAALKPAYKATGRIGGPQQGIPTNDDVAFGTGFLITDRHIMTNQHVYEFYKHYLTGADCGGIEFIAERDRDASDYVPFNGEPPLIISDLDIAIFTLARAVTDRDPIARVAIPTTELDTCEVVTVSYPCPFEVDEAILSVVEKDPIFAVKRLSQGRIFRHSTDTDTPYGVAVKVDARINPEQSLTAICHNASTLGGSSGAPVLDIAGNLVGVHFAGDRAFNGEEAANLAMAIEMLAHIDPTGKASLA